MRIKNNLYLKELEKFRYRYEENLIYPTYKKVIQRGANKVIIEILIQDRTIFVNRNKYIKKKHLKYIKDLINAKLIE